MKRIKVNECVRVGISVVLMVEGDDEANVRRKRGPGSVARYLEARRRSINARGMARMDGELAGAHCTALHCGRRAHCVAHQESPEEPPKAKALAGIPGSNVERDPSTQMDAN